MTPIPEHTDKHFEADLALLKERLLVMGTKVETMIADAVRALVERNTRVANEVIARDSEVDSLEVATDDQAFQILALRQPAAGDLRFVALALKAVTDLERIGDLATNIAERARELAAEPPIGMTTEIEREALLVRRMLREALDALVSRNASQAEAIRRQDQDVDKLHAEIFSATQSLMKQSPANVERGTRLLFVSKYLERIADHATNLSEDVVFLVQGRDIRHTPKEPSRS